MIIFQLITFHGPILHKLQQINLCILFVVLYKASRKKAASEKQDIKSQMKLVFVDVVLTLILIKL